MVHFLSIVLGFSPYSLFSLGVSWFLLKCVRGTSLLFLKNVYAFLVRVVIFISFSFLDIYMYFPQTLVLGSSLGVALYFLCMGFCFLLKFSNKLVT